MAAHSFALVPSSYVLLLRGREVLLQRRHHTGYMDGFWVAGAAGHVEPGEAARQGAVRETAEELGVEIEPAALERDRHAAHGRHGHPARAARGLVLGLPVLGG